MKIDDLIHAFEEEEALKKLRAEKDMRDLKNSHLKGFIDQSSELLKDVIDELNPEKESVEIYFHDRENSLFYRMHCYFAGFQGEIEATYLIKAEQWKGFRIDFGTRSVTRQGTQTLYENLPATELELGALFSKLYQAATYRETQRLAEEQSQAQRYLDFHGYDREQVAQRLEEAIKKFPNYTNDYQERATARIQEIDARELEQAKHQLAMDIRDSEILQLHRILDYAWNRKFTVYKVTYGAKIDYRGQEEDENKIIYTDCFYTLMKEPLNNGMWQAFEAGQYKGWIHPYNLISLEEVTITRQDQAPDDLCRWVTLQSKVVSDAHIICTIPPYELFVFDYEELKVAIEKQDAEVSDAAQENIS